MEADLISLAAVLLFAGALAYNISFLHNKSIGYFSLLQILYLVVIPGFFYVFVFSYMQQILNRPVNSEVVLSDWLLVNLTLLSVLFTYGGVAVHAVTKMMKKILVEEKSRALEINRYFHMSFSHNLIFSGGVLTGVALTLLELNHMPAQTSSGLMITVIKGVILGVSLVMAMYFTARSSDGLEDYDGRWADLKLVFVVGWIGAILVTYGVGKLNPVLRQYNLLLPISISLAILAGLNTVLVVRRLRRGGFKISWRKKRD